MTLNQDVMMNKENTDSSAEVFRDLSPDQVLNLVEESLGVSLTNMFRPLNSYINRVYELERDDGAGLVVKFYRPGRWQKPALLDEHHFLRELAAEEIPVIAPLDLQNGSTIGEFHGVFFSLFPKMGGRSVDEFNDDQWLQLGRLLARVHNIGEKRVAESRTVMKPDISMQRQLEYLLGSGYVPEHLKDELKDAVGRIIEETAALFQDVTPIRIHGDCHFANVIHRPGESFFLIDFDDMVMGPPVQDMWMLLPGPLEDAFVEMDILLEGYEAFRPFDRRSFRLMEPLRAMRFVHYIAWCAYQVAADGASRVAEDFGTELYWRREIDDLKDQLERIRDVELPGGNF